MAAVGGVEAEELREILKELKGLCASGGALKGDEIELQGDHRDRVREALAARGLRVKGR